MRSRAYLAELTWPEVAGLDARHTVVLLPVGATEQHGPHLPLGTDTWVALDLVERVSDHPQVLIAPPLWCGMSQHHMAFPGTLTVRPEVLGDYLYDVISSLYHHGFRSFLVVNGHRLANLPWLQLVGARVHRQLEGASLDIFDPAYMAKTLAARHGFGPVGHADEWETSQLLSAHPERVREERRAAPPAGRRHYQTDPAGSGDTLCYVPGPARREGAGVKGYPERSTAAAGRDYRQHLEARLRQVIAARLTPAGEEIEEECQGGTQPQEGY